MIKRTARGLGAILGAFGLALSMANAGEESKKEENPVEELAKAIKENPDETQNITRKEAWRDTGKKIGISYYITIKEKGEEGREYVVRLAYWDNNPEGPSKEDTLVLLIEGEPNLFIKSPYCSVFDKGLDGFRRGKYDTRLVEGDIAMGFPGIRNVHGAPDAKQIPELNAQYNELTESLRKYIEKQSAKPKERKTD